MEPNKGIFGDIKSYVGSFGKTKESKDKAIQEKAYKIAQPKDPAVAKAQIAKFNVPKLDLSRLPRPDDRVLNANDAALAVEVQKGAMNASKALNIDTKNFFTPQEFDELQSEDENDVKTKSILDDLNKTIDKKT